MAVDDVVSQIIWTRNFVEAQGYIVGASTLYQDNQSAILLEENGIASCSKRTKHLNVKYFFCERQDTFKGDKREMLYIWADGRRLFN